jgi:hypothetical protein
LCGYLKVVLNYLCTFKIVVYPIGTQVKSLKFNNGDFSMPAFSPFHKKGGIISYYEYICN